MTDINTRARYDTKAGIEACINDLATFNALVDVRHKAGYVRQERLNEFYVDGYWYMDTCGNLMTCIGDDLSPRGMRMPKEINPNIPRVCTKDEFWAALPSDTHMAFSMSAALPPARVTCHCCGETWTMVNCQDTIVEVGDLDVPMENYIGQMIGHVRFDYKVRTDGEYLCYGKFNITNEKYVDLTPDGKWEGCVVNRRGDLDVEDTYVVEPGDKLWMQVRWYMHKSCFQKKKQESYRKEFEGIFTAAGIPATLTEVPNEYCNCDRCGPWYKAATPFGVIKLGWRKRVINIDWSETRIRDASLFKKEDVTVGVDHVHAWSRDKAAEYLKTLQATAAGK